MGVKIAAIMMLTGTGTSVAGALVVVQEAMRPSVLSDQSLIPLGVAAAVLLATVAATVRVVRWIDRINQETGELRGEVNALKAVLSRRPADHDDREEA